jgi:hypothetical protein
MQMPRTDPGAVGSTHTQFLIIKKIWATAETTASNKNETEKERGQAALRLLGPVTLLCASLGLEKTWVSSTPYPKASSISVPAMGRVCRTVDRAQGSAGQGIPSLALPINLLRDSGPFSTPDFLSLIQMRKARQYL